MVKSAIKGWRRSRVYNFYHEEVVLVCLQENLHPQAQLRAQSFQYLIQFIALGQHTKVSA